MGRRMIATVAILIGISMLGVGYAAWVMPGRLQSANPDSGVTVQALQTDTLTIEKAIVCEYDEAGNPKRAISLGADLDENGQIRRYPYTWVSFDEAEDLEFTLELTISPEGMSWREWAAQEVLRENPGSIRIWLDGFQVQDEDGNPLKRGETDLGARYISGPTVGEESYATIFYDAQEAVWRTEIGGQAPVGWGIPRFSDGVLQLPLRLDWGSAFFSTENGVLQTVNPNRYFNTSPTYDNRFSEMVSTLAQIRRFEISVRGCVQSG